jgi:hypothetical protein
MTLNRYVGYADGSDSISVFSFRPNRIHPIGATCGALPGRSATKAGALGANLTG